MCPQWVLGPCSSEVLYLGGMLEPTHRACTVLRFSPVLMIDAATAPKPQAHRPRNAEGRGRLVCGGGTPAKLAASDRWGARRSGIKEGGREAGGTAAELSAPAA